MYFKKLCYIILSCLVFSMFSADAFAAKEKEESFAQDRIIIKFKSSDDCMDCFFNDNQRTKEKSPHLLSLDILNKRHKASIKKNMFLNHKGLSGNDAKAKFKRDMNFSKTKHSKRANRVKEDKDLDLSNVFLLEVTPESSLERTIHDYSQDPNVEYVMPDYYVKTKLLVNDPLYNSLWGLDKMRSSEAWDINQGEGTIVAVVDTGVDYTHQDLADNIYMNPFETINGIDDDGNGYIDDIRGWNFSSNNNDPFDGHSHGTHVAGTIAAKGNNSVGVIGVAPMAKIMPLKGLSDGGSGYTSDLAEAIVYAAMNGADVINNSWGCSSACPSNAVAENAVRTAHSLGVVVVFAAGNSNDDAANYSPQNMSETVTVAASTTSDVRASFSNFGAMLDVAAPGSLILSSIPGDSYGYKSGTSMASPHVAGLAALIVSHNPTLTNEGIRNAMRAGADDIHASGFDIDSGHGRVNAYNSLTLNNYIDVNISSPVDNALFDRSKDFVAITGSAFGSGFQSYSIETKDALDEGASWVLMEGPFADPVVSGTLGFINVPSLTDGDHFVRVSAETPVGTLFEDIIQISIATTSPNHPPVLIPIGDKIATERIEMTFDVMATDQDGDQLSYVASLLPAGASFNSTTLEFRWAPSVDQIGQHSATIIVSDGELTDSETFTVTVEANDTTLDTEPPSAITNLTLGYVTDTMVYFTWTPATDNVGIAGHNIYANGRLWKSPPGDNAGLINLDPDTLYTINVVAYDEAGNVGPDVDPMLVVRTKPTPGPNTDPVYDSLPSSIDVFTGQLVDILVIARDAEGDDMHLMLSRNVSRKQSWTIDEVMFLPDGTSSVSGRFMWTPGRRDVGQHQVQFFIRDERSGNTVLSSPVIVNVTAAPKGGGKKGGGGNKGGGKSLK